MNERSIEYHPVFKEQQLGIGTWAWGEIILGISPEYTDQDLKAAFQASLEAGVTFFDTAEVYGQGLSEKILGRFIKRPIGRSR